MKTIFKLFILLSLIISTINANDQIIISNGEWPPFFSQELHDNGATSHIVTKAFEKEGIDVIYKWYPWKRAFHLAKNGDLHATVGWDKTKQREKDFLFSEPILYGNVMFFHLKEKEFSWNKLQDLKALKIGTVTGYEYQGALNKLKQNINIKVYEVINEKKLFELLLNKRFDLVIINMHAGYGILNKFFTKEQINLVTYNNKAFYQEKLRVLFSKKIEKNNDFLIRFNKGLKKLKDSGEFDEIYKKIKPK